MTIHFKMMSRLFLPATKEILQVLNCGIGSGIARTYLFQSDVHEWLVMVVDSRMF
jgi:hypothetical protein